MTEPRHAVVADFEAWVKMGAPDPRVNEGAAVVFQKICQKAV